MIQKQFAEKVVGIIKNDPAVIGLAAAGSWITDEMDEYSDLDLVLVTADKIGGNKEKMLAYARSFGDFISGFTGEHVGEPRLLVCLFDNPLLHVDIKFITLPELNKRIENPVVLFERDGQLTTLIESTTPVWPEPDFQWIEDRFWIWIHYVSAKIGRGEYFDCLTSIDYIRSHVIAPLLQVKNKKLARGMRKVETQLNMADLENLKITVAQYNRESIITALDNIISIYTSLRRKLFTDAVQLKTETQKKCLDYFKKIRQKNK